MGRVEIVAVLGVLALLGLVVEAIRRKQLAEGFSLLWLLTILALLVLALWRELLDVLADVVGIFYPPAALFVVGFGFVLLILLQFSIIVSRLARQNTRLAQRLAILEWRLEHARRDASTKTTDCPER